MKIATFVTDLQHHDYRRFLVGSCHYYNLDLSPLVGKKRIKPSRLDRICNWFNPKERGFQQKDILLLEYLETLPDNELVLASDGYDTFFVANEDEIQEKYAAFGKPLVFSAELYCRPDPSLESRFPHSPGEMRFLNSGGFIGRARELRKALKDVRKISCPSRYSWSNQYRWSLLFLQQPDLIALDYQSSIFFCAASAYKEGPTWECDYWSNELISHGRVRLKNGSQPCHIHFNGPIAKHLDHLSPALEPLCPWFR